MNPGHKIRYWTDEETASLKEYATSMTLQEAVKKYAQDYGFDEMAVRAKIARMSRIESGWTDRKVHNPDRQYSSTEIALLRKLSVNSDTEKTIKEFVARTGRSAESARIQLRKIQPIKRKKNCSNGDRAIKSKIDMKNIIGKRDTQSGTLYTCKQDGRVVHTHVGR